MELFEPNDLFIDFLDFLFDLIDLASNFGELVLDIVLEFRIGIDFLVFLMDFMQLFHLLQALLFALPLSFQDY